MSEEPALPAAQSTAIQATTWGIGTAGLALLVSFVVYLIGTEIVLALFVANHVRNNLVIGILSYQFLALGTTVSAAVLIVRRLGLSLTDLGYRFPGWSTLVTSAAVVLPLVFLAIGIVSLLFHAFFPQYQLRGNASDIFRGIPKHIDVVREALIVLWAAVEAPLIEETLFRGIVFQGVRNFLNRWTPLQVAVFLSSLVSGALFGLAHFEIHTLPILVLLGIILAYVFQFTRSIYASALVHGLINLIAVIGTFGVP